MCASSTVTSTQLIVPRSTAGISCASWGKLCPVRGRCLESRSKKSPLSFKSSAMVFLSSDSRSHANNLTVFSYLHFFVRKHSAVDGYPFQGNQCRGTCKLNKGRIMPVGVHEPEDQRQWYYIVKTKDFAATAPHKYTTKPNSYCSPVRLCEVSSNQE